MLHFVAFYRLLPTLLENYALFLGVSGDPLGVCLYFPTNVMVVTMVPYFSRGVIEGTKCKCQWSDIIYLGQIFQKGLTAGLSHPWDGGM